MINRFARRKLHDQEMEGRVIPKEILERLNVQKEIIEEIRRDFKRSKKT